MSRLVGAIGVRCALSERRCTLSEWSFTFELVGGVCRLEASIRLRRVRRECPRQPDLSPAGRGGGQARATGGAAMLAAGACPRAGEGGRVGRRGPPSPLLPLGGRQRVFWARSEESRRPVTSQLGLPADQARSPRLPLRGRWVLC